MAQQRLTLRSVKGSPLTVPEADAMMRYLDDQSIPKWNAVDAAIPGAYPIGIIVDSGTTGVRYRLKNDPTVDPDTDVAETHWDIISSAGGGDDVSYSDSSAALTYPETPSLANFTALRTANNADGGDLLEYVTPQGKTWTAQVYDTSTIRNIQVDSIEYASRIVAVPSDFRPHYVISTTNDGKQWRNNATSTAWIEVESGSGGVIDSEIDFDAAGANAADSYNALVVAHPPANYEEGQTVLMRNRASGIGVPVDTKFIRLRNDNAVPDWIESI